MGVARKWHFSTAGGAENLGGVSGDLSEHRGSGILLLGITSLFMHKLTGLYKTERTLVMVSAWSFYGAQKFQEILKVNT